jgi:hypothetical protein
LGMLTVPEPVSRIPQYAGPAVPRPKSSATAQEVQNKTGTSAVIPTFLTRRTPQHAGLLYERLLL